MTKRELVEILAGIGASPSHRRGQNFMVDTNMLDFIVRSAAAAKGQMIIEIGPGLGALTRPLVDSGAEVTAIEFDRKLASYIRDNISADNFTLIEGDACKIDLREMTGIRPFRVIANLPYSISSPFIGNILKNANPPIDMLFMLQKETAERLASAPGDKHYGSLAVRTQCLYKVKVLRSVPRQVFHPQPDIDSALTAFTLLPTPLPHSERKAVFRDIEAAFSRRRRKMARLLTAIHPAEKVESAFSRLGLSPDVRAENLSPAQFIDLSRLLTAE